MTKPPLPADDDQVAIDATLRAVLRDVLGLSEERAATLDEMTPLFGAMPELDSMSVVNLLGELEERLGIRIEDDEVDGSMLDTFGHLLGFVRSKAQA
ncbi:MAG: acyl carrier protein [Sphingomonadaceae bacterium]|nr:acyl carrier protein [Sphingomonadaceae bacterium]